LVDGHVLALSPNGSIVWKVWRMDLIRVAILNYILDGSNFDLICYWILLRKQLMVQYLLGHA